MSYTFGLYIKLVYTDGYEIEITTEQYQRYTLYFSHFFAIDPFMSTRLKQEGQGVGWIEEFWG